MALRLIEMRRGGHDRYSWRPSQANGDFNPGWWELRHHTLDDPWYVLVIDDGGDEVAPFADWYTRNSAHHRNDPIDSATAVHRALGKRQSVPQRLFGFAGFRLGRGRIPFDNTVSRSVRSHRRDTPIICAWQGAARNRYRSKDTDGLRHLCRGLVSATQ